MNRKRVNNVILIFIDDVRAGHLFELIENGKAPNIAKLARGGISCQNCVTSYPSITFPNYSNLITGSYSGYYPKEGSGIPEYHYLTRTDPPSEGSRYPKIINCGAGSLYKLNKQLGPNCKTIFEQVEEDENHFSSCNIVSRGSKLISPSPYTTEVILNNVAKAFKHPDEFDFSEPPIVTVAYVPYTDHLMHLMGFDHEDYINELLKCDAGIGNIIKTLKETGYHDSTAIGILSDHGNYKAKQLYNLEPYFNEIGLMQYNPKKGTGDFDAVLGSVGFFNFHGMDWHHHPTIEEMKKYKLSTTGKKDINLIDTLWKIPGAKYMYYRDDDNTPDKGTIHLRYRDEHDNIHEARIEFEGHGKNQKTSYIHDDLDIYGYEHDEQTASLLDGKPHDIDAWLEGTNRVDFPMIIDQIPRYLKNPRSCDIMISTLGEYSFGFEHGKTKPSSRYSHDICLRNSMIVPFIIGGTLDIPSKELSYCKTTDMVPSLLSLLGKKPHFSVVGKSVI
ncbi:MAG: alkaline phosphatase family protein [Promethearchaeota archaeon]